jgi:hypothetical protein
MARTDVPESVQNAGAALTQNTRDLAASTLDTVRGHASSAGETIGSAVTAALDTAVEHGRKAQKRAQKQTRKTAKKAKKRAAKKAQNLSILAQEKIGRRPRGRRRVSVLGALTLAGVTVAIVLKRRQSPELAPEPYAPLADPASPVD